MTHIPEGYIWDLDRELMLHLNGSWGGVWDTFWWTLSQPASWIPLYLVVIGLVWRRFGWRAMLVVFALVVLGVGLADQTANFFKLHTPKFRPTHTALPWAGGTLYNDWVHTVKGYVGGSFGTVSGHAATSMAIAVTVAGVWRRRWFSCAAGLYVALTVFSRIYLGVHFPMDIVLGLTAGTLIGLLMLWLWRIVNRKWGARLAVPEQ